MKHAAVLLIVGTLSGTPVADLVCVSVCNQSMAAHPLGCHHDMATGASPAITTLDDSCARLFVSVLYLKEEAQRPAFAVMPASAVSAASIGPGEALPASAHRFAGDVQSPATMRILRL